MPVDFDPQLGDLHLGLHLEIFHSAHIRDRRFHLPGRPPQNLQIVAVELDRHLGLDPGEHVGNQVGKGLLDTGRDALHVGKGFPNLFESLLATLATVRVERCDELGSAHRHGVFVQFGTPRLPQEGPDLVDLLEPRLHLSGSFLGTLQ